MSKAKDKADKKRGQQIANKRAIGRIKKSQEARAHKKAVASDEAVNLATVLPPSPEGADDRAPLSVGDDRDSPPSTGAPDEESDDALQPRSLGGRHPSIPQSAGLSAEELREAEGDLKSFTREHALAPKPTSRRRMAPP